ncbi:MAG TPA: PAS domain-containing sensor histidine kinase [Chloroflexi bacterium]|nr:PAS domain-containing sensor histidine kinase [Chloroflexota bacterium]
MDEDEIYLSRILPVVLNRQNQAYLWADADLRVRYASQQAASILGVKELAGLSLSDVAPELLGMEETLKTLARERHLPFLLRHINRDTPGGKTRYFSIALYPSKAEQPDGLVVALKDTTFTSTLLQELTQGRNTLRLMQQQLEEANRFKNLTLTILSQEINGRLEMMLNYVDVYVDQLLAEEDNPDVESVETLTTLRKGIHTLAMSLQQLLSLEQIERGHVTLNKETCDLTALVQHTWKIYLELAQDQFILHKEISPHHAWVCGDPNRLEQVLYNLISNAVKYTPSGEHITVGVESDKSETRLWVENTGIGISSERRESIFHPRFHTGNLDHLLQQGSGLGLFIVQRIVEAHEGRVELTSDGSSFVRFTVYFPTYHPTAEC